MACVRSLGLHEPSALPFLVAEDLLPPDPSENQYEWSTTVDEGPNGLVDDELVWTTSCVVWSRAGVVKRVFRLDIEREEIKHALFTRFSVEKSTESDGQTTQTQGLNGNSGSQPGQSRGPQSQPSQNPPGTSPSLHDRPAQGSQAVENEDSSRWWVLECMTCLSATNQVPHYSLFQIAPSLFDGQIQQLRSSHFRCWKFGCVSV